MTLFITNLSGRTHPDDLKILFEPFGKVKAIELLKEPESKKFSGAALIEMQDEDAAKKAISGLNGITLFRRMIKVQIKPTAAAFGFSSDKIRK